MGVREGVAGSASEGPVGGIPPHAARVEEVLRAQRVDPARGLSPEDALARLARFGPNALPEPPRSRWPRVLARQFASPLILLLAVAAAVSAALGEVIDAAAILVVVLLNGALGFVQEWRAARELAALRRMLAPVARALRDGEPTEVPAAEVVPGDVVLLELGDRVPADLRVLEAHDLRADESSLTGESAPIAKAPEPVPPDAALAERASMLWLGANVAAGHGRGLAVATGAETEFGRIARLTAEVGEDATPLQRRLSGLGRALGLAALGVAGLTAALGALAGRPFLDMALTGISLAVAAVPEGLPAVVTITLALGVRRMVRRKALLRRLAAAEGLGAATVVCTDKTGTITRGEMTVARLWTPAGDVLADELPSDLRERPDLSALLETALAANRARVVIEDGARRALGSPTEAALATLALRVGLAPPASEAVVGGLPFSSERKRMSVVERAAEGAVVHVKGAPEEILARCSRIRVGEEERPIAEADREAALAAVRAMAGDALRTLAFARKTAAEDAASRDALEEDLTFLGLAGLEDPPRPEVAEAIRRARDAGVRVILITGDAPATAVAIAERVGLAAERVITGPELARLDDAALSEALASPVLFARIAPEQKLRIVTALQDAGHAAAMTGDGVNDAPALRKADVGVAMGLRGTDVARAASDMVLLDDNFATIVSAIEEGRRQYENIRRFVLYLVSSNLAEILAVLAGVLLGGPVLLLPAQILWINLVTDGASAVALGLEPAEPDLMRRPPRRPRESVIGRGGAAAVLLLGGYMGLASLALFGGHAAEAGPEALARARSGVFTALVVLELVNTLNFRAARTPLWRAGFFTNPWLLAALVATFALQLAVLHIPFAATLLGVQPLAWGDWADIGLAALPLILVPEVYKWIVHRRALRGPTRPPVVGAGA